MNKSKIVSVRIDEDLLDQLPVKSAFSGGVTRSNVINMALRVAIEWKKRHVRWLGSGFHPEFGDVVDKLEFEFHREHK